MSAETPNKIVFFEDLGQFLNSAPLIPKDYFGFYYRDGFFRINSYSGAEEVISMGAPGTYVLRAGDTMTGDLNMGGNTITGLDSPVAGTDAATKQYVDALIIGGGINAKEPVRVATTANIALSGLPVIDGVSLNIGDRVLVKDQTFQEDNGIYNAAAGAWTRSTDADTDTEVVTGMFCFTLEGAVNYGIGYILVTPNPITVGVTPLLFSPFTSYTIYSADGNGLKQSGNTFFVSLDGTTLSQSVLGLKVNLITDANITAGVSRAKLAAGTANRLVYNDGTIGLLSDLPAITASRALVSDTDGLPVASVTTSAEIAFVNGVTSSIQTQLNNKQDLDADLTSIAGQTGLGFLARVAVSSWTLRTLTGSSNLSVSNGTGALGDPTVDLTDTTVTPGSYGSATAVATFTVDQKGRLTAAGSATITAAGIGAQPASAELTGLSGLSGTGFVVRTGSGTYANRSLASGSGISITNTDGLSGNPSISASNITNSNISVAAAIDRTKLASGNAHRIVLNDASGVMAESAALTNGQILIGFTGNAPVVAGITGTTDQITVTNGGGSITLSTPQNIATTSSPTFAGLTLTSFSGVVKASAGILSASTIVNADVSATAAIAFSKMAALTINRALVSDGTGVVSASSITSTELGNLTGVNFLLTAHGSRHNPGGADALTTATASSITTNANTEGSAASFARSDHTHRITSGAASLGHLIQFDGTNWNAVYPETTLNLTRAWRIYDEFISGDNGAATNSINPALGWHFTKNGAAGAMNPQSGSVTSNHPGVIRLLSGGAGGNYVAMRLGHVVLGGGELEFETEINLAALASVTNDWVFRWGLGDLENANHNNGVYFEYNRATSANWLIKSASGGTRTSTTTSTAVDSGVWIRLTINVNAAASTITYYINGTSVGTITTNIPTVVSQFHYHQTRTAGTPTGIDIDYFYARQRFTTAR